MWHIYIDLAQNTPVYTQRQFQQRIDSRGFSNPAKSDTKLSDKKSHQASDK